MVAAQPDDARTLQVLGAAYVQKLVQSADPAYADLGQRALARAAALAPDDVATLVTRASLALTLHQFASARELGLKVRRIAPANNDVLVVLVDAEIELGRYDDAASDLQTLLDRRPGFAALARVSYLRELHGDVDGALAALRQAQSGAAASSDYDIATIAAIRGDLLYNHGRIDDAAIAYGEALAKTPRHVVAIAGRARVLVARGDLAAATATLSPVAETLPSPTLVALLGDIAALDGRAADAARSFDVARATTALQAAGGATIDLEAALFEADHNGDPARVLDLAAKAYKARPSVHAADAVAWARFRTGDLEGASKAIEEAMRLQTLDASLAFHAAAIHHASGRDARARTELADAFTINPWFAIGNRPEVSALAATLGVSTPAGWSNR